MTLLEEFFTDKMTPAFADLPRSTRIADVGTLERYLQHFTKGQIRRQPAWSDNRSLNL